MKRFMGWWSDNVAYPLKVTTGASALRARVIELYWQSFSQSLVKNFRTKVTSCSSWLAAPSHLSHATVATLLYLAMVDFLQEDKRIYCCCRNILWLDISTVMWATRSFNLRCRGWGVIGWVGRYSIFSEVVIIRRWSTSTPKSTENQFCVVQ